MDKPVRVWQRMLSGRRLDLVDPSPSDIDIEDIAHGLSRVARWNGQTRGEYVYSVAQHSFLVEQLLTEMCPGVPAEVRLIALLHDAPEYVVGDLISPFKTIIGKTYKEIEERLMSAILERFDVSLDLAREVKDKIKQADIYAGYCEAIYLAGFSEDEARQFFCDPEELLLEKVKALLVPMELKQVQSYFLNRFYKLEKIRS